MYSLDLCSQAASVMQNQQVQQLWVLKWVGGIESEGFVDVVWLSVLVPLSMSGMMSNAVGGPAAGVGGLSDISSLIEA